MKYYFRENVRRYEKMSRMGLDAWSEWAYGGTDLHGFSSRDFLETAIPRLRRTGDRPNALELGTGVGPGALFLNDRGYQVTGYDLIPEAIRTAREIAASRGLSIQYDVMDVTQIPHEGEGFDLIVDSFCINHIVYREERRAVFESVKARLNLDGYYLVSSSVYEPSRHNPETKVIDKTTGVTYDAYDGDCLYDPKTDYYFEPIENAPSEYEKTVPCSDGVEINGLTYIPMRCYRDGARLRAELAEQGFDVIFQNGKFEENLICVHAGSGIDLAKPT